jgi:hypothetical protein
MLDKYRITMIKKSRHHEQNGCRTVLKCEIISDLIADWESFEEVTPDVGALSGLQY